MDELFKIYKVDVNEALRIGRNDNSPHQHSFEELIIGLKGKLTHFIDYKTQDFDAPFATFVTKGKIHRIEPHLLNNECDFWVIRFKSEFMSEITFQLYNYYHDQANFELSDASQVRRLDNICSLILEETLLERPNLGIIKDLLSALFGILDSERIKNGPYNTLLSSQNKTFQSFLAILEDNFRRSEGVSFYAEKLFTTSKTLNTITQNILHQSVSEIIETRKLIEAKNLLYTTSKTVSEIGFELGYSDKAYFTSVFKKKSGQTPTEFREEMKTLIS